MTFILYRDRKKEFRWSMHARNGRKTGDSSEGYKRRSHCLRMIEKIIMGPHTIVEDENHSHNRR